ncbi:MAG TPA: tRNA 2-thiocytidine biosynthesis protein TtcA, partial [Euryarchaeota archaeon]|nr:tRNA 2-thiocytidine biosynthesis protein TtcA [Euryarchaeota archaeon]
MKCSRCDRDAVIFIRYNGEHLCAEHFMEFLESRVKHELRKQVDLKPGDRIVVGTSGGKDSTTTVYLLKKIFSMRRDIEIIAVTIDEGIEGYRDRAIGVLSGYLKKIGVEHRIYRIKERFGKTIDEIAMMDKTLIPCTYCGVFRRSLLNSAARELDADYVATGLNLDDTAQSIIMNFARGDLDRLARLGPHSVVKEDLIPRIQPLRMIPEKEVLLYAILRGIEFYHGTCPYADLALRNQFRKAIDEWEARSPGTRHSIVS